MTEANQNAFEPRSQGDKFLNKRANKKKKVKKDPILDNIYMKEAVFALIQSQHPKKSKRQVLRQAIASTQSKRSGHRFSLRTKSSLGADTTRCLDVLLNAENRQPNLGASTTVQLLSDAASRKPTIGDS